MCCYHLDCDDVVPDAAEYVCSQCQGGSSPHDNVQSWIATCEGAFLSCIKISHSWLETGD